MMEINQKFQRSRDDHGRHKPGRSRTLLPNLRLVVVALLLGLPATGCASCEAAPASGYEGWNQAISEQLSKVGLGPGDLIEVKVYGEEALSGQHRVAPDGTIQFPLVNQVFVDGMTTTEVADTLMARLKEGFLRAPSVSVLVKEYNSKKVFVLGEVQRPGTFPFSGGMNIVEAITLAGGFKDSANANQVVLTRQGPQGTQRVPVPVRKITEGHADNLFLQPGDIVFVPDLLL